MHPHSYNLLGPSFFAPTSVQAEAEEMKKLFETSRQH